MINTVQAWHWFWALLVIGLSLSFFLTVYIFVLPRFRGWSNYIDFVPVELIVFIHNLLLGVAIEMLIMVGYESGKYSEAGLLFGLSMVFFPFFALAICWGFTQFIADWLYAQSEKHILKSLP